MKRWLRRLGIASIVVVDLLVFASGAALTLGAGSHPRLAVELLRMADADRRARLAQIEAGRPGSGEMLVPDSPQERSYRRVAALDRRHQQRLGAIVDQIGWPHAGLVGDAAAHAAWLLAQHADLDFQVDALARMRERRRGATVENERRLTSLYGSC